MNSTNRGPGQGDLLADFGQDVAATSKVCDRVTNACNIHRSSSIISDHLARRLRDEMCRDLTRHAPATMRSMAGFCGNLLPRQFVSIRSTACAAMAQQFTIPDEMLQPQQMVYVTFLTWIQRVAPLYLRDFRPTC